MSGGKVQPASSPNSQSHSRLAVVSSRFRKVFRNWRHFQVGHQHYYSIEHLLALREYCERTSRFRVVLVCLISLTPAFALAILIELIPLRSPTEGWKANYAYWIRVFVSSVPCTLGTNFVVKEGIDPGAVTSLRLIVAAICTNICNTALLIGVAAKSTFPIPYGSVLTVVPYAIFGTLFIGLAVGLGNLRSSARLRQQASAQICAFSALVAMQVVYSSFGYVFNQLAGYEQTAFVFVLPVIKFVVKQWVARAYKHYRECVGPIIVLSVDLCNVLYVVSCMQTSGSALTTMLMIGTDAFFIVLALHSIYIQSSTTQGSRVASTNEDYLGELLRLVQKSFRDPSTLHSQRIQVAARFSLPLSNESTQFITELVRTKQRTLKLSSNLHAPATPTRALSKTIPKEIISLPGDCDAEGTDPKFVPSSVKSQQGADISDGPKRYQLSRFNTSRLSTKASTIKSIRAGSHAFNSVNFLTPVRIAPSPTAVRFSHHEHITEEVEDALQALFHSEYLLMAEYIECVVPILYVLYLTLLYHLPTAAFYPQTSSKDYDHLTRTQISIVCYALLELASFVVLNFLLKRRFGFWPLYQLAFVLETQVSNVQGFLFLWVLSILEVNLVHNGTVFCLFRVGWVYADLKFALQQVLMLFLRLSSQYQED